MRPLLGVLDTPIHQPRVDLGVGAAPRDRFIGWTPQLREKNLPLVVDNPRFLILPWIEIPNLSSHTDTGDNRTPPLRALRSEDKFRFWLRDRPVRLLHVIIRDHLADAHLVEAAERVGSLIAEAMNLECGSPPRAGCASSRRA